LTFYADNLTAGDVYKITYTITATSTTGNSSITVSGEVDNISGDSTGVFRESDCFDWNTTGTSLGDNYTVTGTVDLIDTTTNTDSEGVVRVDFGSTATLTCGPGVQGTTFGIGPSSMEGALTVSPGDWISGGYRFKFIGSHAATQYTVTATVTVPVVCPDTSVQNIVIPLGAPGQLNGGGVSAYTYSIAANDKTFHASGDQTSILSWEGAVQAPATLCGGVPGRNSKGAIFNATVNQSPQVGVVHWQFHYRDPNAMGKGNVNCTDASNPLRNNADVCGPSWSQAVTNP
jgi:hypothetical protein